MFYKMADNDDRPKRESKTKFIGPFISVHLNSTVRLLRDCNIGIAIHD